MNLDHTLVEKMIYSGRVLVNGPAGSGKTTLVRDFITHSRDRGNIFFVLDSKGELSEWYKANPDNHVMTITDLYQQVSFCRSMIDLFTRNLKHDGPTQKVNAWLVIDNFDLFTSQLNQPPAVYGRNLPDMAQMLKAYALYDGRKQKVLITQTTNAVPPVILPKDVPLFDLKIDLEPQVTKPHQLSLLAS
jgi:GTPase SAR1 family protein